MAAFDRQMADDALRCEDGQGEESCGEALLQQPQAVGRAVQPKVSSIPRSWRALAGATSLAALVVAAFVLLACADGHGSGLATVGSLRPQAVQDKSMVNRIMSIMSQGSADTAADQAILVKNALTAAIGNHDSLTENVKDWFSVKNLTEEQKAQLEEKVHDWMHHRRPREDLNDGNVCADDEELFMKLCYKKCALLTAAAHEGPHPIRTTAWSCCLSEPCDIAKQKWTFPKPCSGFDTSGDSTGNACPHTPGTCMADHELFLGVCYRRCALDDMAGIYYSHRMSPVSCCRSDSKLKCVDPFNIKVNKSYAMHAHMPNVSLTERSSVSEV
jgi:hypothetical protein